MESEHQFTLAIIRYIITGFVVVVLAGIGSCQASKYQYRAALDDAIQAGASPMAARCAVLGDTSYGSQCGVIYAAEAERSRQ